MKLRRHLYWGSHLPVLIRLMEITDGDVLELGTGLYSTPFLHYASLLRDRKLLSYESDESYFDLMREYSVGKHAVKLVPDWNTVDLSGEWDIAFIDQKDEFRAQTAKKLAYLANTKYVVLHDSQEESFGYKGVYPLFKYRYDYKKLSPHTTVLSNYREIKEI